MKFKNPNKKIAFICSPNLTAFINPICEWILHNTDMRIRRVFTQEKEAIVSALKWADTVWLEWANELAVTLTHKAVEFLKDKEVVLRCHSYEALSGLFQQINFLMVSKVVFVADHMESLGRSMMPKEIPSVVIPNGLQTENFPLSYKKHGGAIAHLGHISHKKGPMLMLHAFYYLLQNGEDVTLHVGGNMQDMRYDYYLQYMVIKLNLQNNVRFYGKIEDVPAWLQDKECVLCTSPWESQNMSVMEAMLCGCRPLVHTFPGADQIYKPEYCWSTLDELHRLYSTETKPEEYREFIAERYNFNSTLEQVLELLGDE